MTFADDSPLATAATPANFIKSRLLNRFCILRQSLSRPELLKLPIYHIADSEPRPEGAVDRH
jgi:hypothetical protein